MAIYNVVMDQPNFHYLLYFWTVAREGGVSKAAEKLRLSQPTISAQVRLLEEAARSGDMRIQLEVIIIIINNILRRSISLFIYIII